MKIVLKVKVVIHNSVTWSLCVYGKSMPPLYDQKHMLPIGPTAQFLFSQLPLVLENPLSFIPRLDLPFLSLLSTKTIMYILFLLSPQLSHDFQNVILLSAVTMRPGQPFVVEFVISSFLG